MTRYPRQVDREYLSCRSGGLNKIQMVDGGTLDLDQDLVACNRRRRYIVEHQLPTVFQQSDSFHASSPSFGREHSSPAYLPTPRRYATQPLGNRCAGSLCRRHTLYDRTTRTSAPY